MSDRLRILLTLLVIFTCIVAIRKIHQKKLSLNYSLLWIVLGAAMLLCVLFPNIVYALAGLVGIDLPINMLLVGFAFFALVMLFYLTGIVSRDNEKLRSLTQQIGLLEKRVRELEAHVNDGSAK